ncbi:hypothetical protein EIN_057660 [Entamoeba invadens IP1]|uniref:hypothetical protein n=1 Tax=Entamoeba invadens IP1 TaxID=370355 RepID=UPI0002C3F5F6|nr:hypothetical protein EIN_057660 [Entamoeba invadens IP1]ELP93361.1 hypothetical protein EIN_057660 [Entamoeba invadens IP1]|eukprot:XP_004260132.1 hypothetical protein EIN_057660 [Entamoeba invadens IP1]
MSDKSGEDEHLNDEMGDIYYLRSDDFKPNPTTHRGWSKQLSVTILAAICLIANSFCLIFVDNNLHGFILILSVGIVEGIVFLAYSLVKFVLRIDKVQQFLKKNRIVKKVFSTLINNYDEKTFVFKLPNVEKIIAENMVYVIPEDDRENLSPLARFERLYFTFCQQNEYHIKIFSIFLSIVACVVAFVELFFFSQSAVSFRNLYSQVVEYTIVCFINISLAIFFFWKILLVVFFVLFELSFAIVHNSFKQETFLSFFLLLVVTVIFGFIVPMTSVHFYSLLLILFTFAVLISIVIVLAIKATILLYNLTRQNRSLWVYIKEKITAMKSRKIATTIVLVFILFVFVLNVCSVLVFVMYTKPEEHLVTTFDTVNATFAHNSTSYCDFEKHISQLTFGIGEATYFRQEYAKPSIITPTINMSDLLEVSSSTKDYYRMTSERIPMNGIVYYPSVIKPMNEVVFILSNSMTNLIDTDMGYVYLQESLAENGIVSISLDHGFLDKDVNGEWIVPKDNTSEVSEVYIEARVRLTLNAMNYLYDRLNQHFNMKLNFSGIGIIGDREGGGVAMRVSNTLKNNEQVVGIDNMQPIKVVSFSAMNCKEIPINNPIQNLDSFFLETLPELSAYDPPLLSSYYLFNKTERNDSREYQYSGCLIIEKGIGTSFNMKDKRNTSDIWVDKLYKNEPNMLTDTELRCVSNNYLTSHFLCSLVGDCTNLDLLKDFKNGKGIIPTKSEYYSTFESSKEVIVFANGSENAVIMDTNATFSGKLFQNIYQSLHLIFACDAGQLCYCEFKRKENINASGIKFSFFKDVDNKEIKYDQFVVVYKSNGEIFRLPSFTYKRIDTHDSSTDIAKLFLLQTYSFDFPTPNVYVTKFRVYFTKEILLDDIAFYY